VDRLLGPGEARRISEGLQSLRGGEEERLPLVHIQSRFRVLSYSNSHETSDLRTYAFKG